MREKADRGKGIDPLDHGRVADFFGAAIVKIVKAGKLDSHPLYGAHDFEGSVIKIAPDPDAPSVDRQVAVVVELPNFGEKQQATFLVQADPTAWRAAAHRAGRTRRLDAAVSAGTDGPRRGRSLPHPVV